MVPKPIIGHTTAMPGKRDNPWVKTLGVIGLGKRGGEWEGHRHGMKLWRTGGKLRSG